MGESVTITLINNKGERYINGVVVEFNQTVTRFIGTKDEQTFYQGRIVPMLWQLTLGQSCAIFQEKDTLEIVASLLDSYKVKADNKVKEAGKVKFDFCVQFNETDFAFVSRLLEAAGIFYFFQHTKSTHTMILSDSPTAFEAMIDPDQDFLGPEDPDPPAYGITTCDLRRQIVSSEYAVKDYNFETPETNLFAKTTGPGLGGKRYFYPGRYWNANQQAGEAISKVWLESAETPAESIDGTSTVPFLTPGYCFSLKGHPRSDMNNIKFAVRRVEHYAQLKANLREIPAHQIRQPYDVRYENKYTGFSKTLAFRPPRLTPWPQITTQTAIVTGKADEEIWTDKYGRIKVKFHWDLSDTENDKTSCWIRVMQTWAQKKWGTLFIPRIGQEVVVQFIDGDPNRPVITGAVYNNTNLPPYLPDEPTMSTIKTNTSKGGGGYNELRFNDKKDSEEIFIHAQKDMKTVVEHDQSLTVTKGNRTVDLKEGNYERTLEKGNETITLKEGNYDETLEKGNYSLTLKSGNRDITVTGGDETHTNKQNYTQKVTQNYELDVQGNYTCKVQGNHTTQVTGNAQLKVTGNLKINVTGSITIKGTAGITGTSNAALTLSGTASATLKSSASLMLQGSASATISGGGSCSITAGMVSING